MKIKVSNSKSTYPCECFHNPTGTRPSNWWRSVCRPGVCCCPSDERTQSRHCRQRSRLVKTSSFDTSFLFKWNYLLCDVTMLWSMGAPSMMWLKVPLQSSLRLSSQQPWPGVPWRRSFITPNHTSLVPAMAVEERGERLRELQKLFPVKIMKKISSFKIMKKNSIKNEVVPLLHCKLKTSFWVYKYLYPSDASTERLQPFSRRVISTSFKMLEFCTNIELRRRLRTIPTQLDSL